MAYKMYEFPTEEPMATFVRRMNKVLRTRRITINELAEAIGVRPTSITAWNHAKRGITTGNAIAVAKVLGVSLDWLCGLKDKGDAK